MQVRSEEEATEQKVNGPARPDPSLLGRQSKTRQENLLPVTIDRSHAERANLRLSLPFPSLD